jgi:hypothetical protein
MHLKVNPDIYQVMRWFNGFSRLFCLIACILLVIPFTTGATCEATGNGACFYVATTGSDSNNGSFESPKASIEGADIAVRARAANAPGSIIYVMPGVYYQNNAAWPNRITADGTATNPIILTSYNLSDIAILDGNQNTATRSGGWQVLAFNDPVFYNIRNLELRNGPKGTYGTIQNSIIENLTVHDIYNRGVDNPAGIELTGTSENNTIRNNRVYNVRHNDTLHHNAACIMIFSGNNNTIHNNELYFCNSGIYHKHHQTINARQKDINSYFSPGPYYLTIYRNYVHDIAINGISLGSSSAHVYENIVAHAQWGFRIGYGDACRRNMDTGCMDNNIYHNTVYNISSYAGGTPARTSSAIQLVWRDSISKDLSFNTTLRDNLIINVSSALDLPNYSIAKYLDYNCYELDRVRMPYDPAIMANDMYNSRPGTLADYQANGFDLQSIITSDTVVNAAQGDFRLSATSPCKGAASDGLDIGAWTSSNPSYTIGLYDMLPAVYNAGAGDVNKDRTVDFADLITVLVDWGKGSSFNANSDINSDNTINLFDLVLITRNWGNQY